MNKSTLILFFSTLTLLPSMKAQHQFGASLGPTISYNQQTLFDNGAVSPRTDYGINLHFIHRINKWAAFKTGLKYTRNGMLIDNYQLSDESGIIGIYDVNGKLDFASIPLAMRFSYEKRSWGAYADAGVYLGFLFSESFSFDGENQITGKQEYYTIDLNDNYKTTDLGGVFNAGIYYQLNKQYRIFLEIQNQIGLTDMFEDQFNRTDYQRNSGVFFGFSYVWKNHRKPKQKRTFEEEN